MNQTENQKVSLEFWKSALNPLTWTEILHQVLVDAAFGSKLGAMHRAALNKVEPNHDDHLRWNPTRMIISNNQI
nr:homeobox-ddt domain protein rlt3 [Quercus suber]